MESSPTQANVELSTGQTCVTPCKLNMKRKHGFTAVFKKPGYKTLEATVDSKVKGGGAAGAAGNILFGGLIGAGVDATNGSMKDLTPNPLQVTLEPEATSMVPAVTVSEAVTTTDVPASALPAATEPAPAQSAVSPAPPVTESGSPSAEAAPAPGNQ